MSAATGRAAVASVLPSGRQTSQSLVTNGQYFAEANSEKPASNQIYC